MTPFSHADRIRACWLGKNIGGTLGAPHEGKPGPLSLEFYEPVPARPLPNDDLDLQVVWLHYLLDGGHRTVTPDILADAWARHVRFPFDEYGIVPRNTLYGLAGPARGAFDNYFAECMGGAIRSELWACLAPGDPARAAGFAWADASVDHAGEGVYAEMFHAALQAAAFVETDREKLIDVGLRYVPAGTRLGRALRDTQRWWRELGDWPQVRERIVREHAPGNFTDVVPNLCFELLGWYAGDGDFGRSICIAVNCGLDTDCTGATLGALLGIIDPACIPEHWVRPIGTTIVLSPEIHGVPVPRDIDHLTELTLQLGRQLADFPAPIGPVLPAGPQLQPNAFTKIEHDEAAASATVWADDTPPTGEWRPAVAHGHWTRLSPLDFTDTVSLRRYPLHVPTSYAGRPLRLLVAGRPKVRAWVDARLVLDYDYASWRADPFAAPTLHRGGLATCTLKDDQALAAGTHELIVAVARPDDAAPTDLLVALGDATTNLWIPDGFNRR